MSSPTVQRIAQLNDQFRRAEPGIPGKTVLTSGIVELLKNQQIPLPKLAQLVANYEDFTEDNDPYGEHDFGVFEFGGIKCFWKIDVYDPDHLTEAPKTWGSSGHLDFLIRVCRIEGPGIPGLEPGPERAVEHAGPGLEHEVCSGS